MGRNRSRITVLLLLIIVVVISSVSVSYAKTNKSKEAAFINIISYDAEADTMTIEFGSNKPMTDCQFWLSITRDGVLINETADGGFPSPFMFGFYPFSEATPGKYVINLEVWDYSNGFTDYPIYYASTTFKMK